LAGKTAYVAASEARCATANTAFDRLSDKYPDISQFAPYLAEGIPVANAAQADLAKLAAGRPDEAQLKTIFLTPLEGQTAAVVAYSKTLPAVITEQTELADLVLPEADLRAMKAYGFDECVTWAETE
jgi:hypothetical protein